MYKSLSFVGNLAIGRGCLTKSWRFVSGMDPRKLSHLDDLLDPKQIAKPGHEKERATPDLYEDEFGHKSSNLGSHRDFISMVQRPTDMEPQDIRYKYRRAKLHMLREDQRYHEDVLEKLGPDLMSAYFFCLRDGAVKFADEGHWYRMQENGHMNVLLPVSPKGQVVEAVDASNSSLLYEGIDYLRGLKHLRYLNLSGCKRIDDFCLHKLTVHLPTLEYLDISSCPNISERGLATLHAFPNLKKLNVADLEGVTQKQLVCMLLEEAIPDLFIDGVEYGVDTMDHELEIDRQKWEKRYALRQMVDYDDNYLVKRSGAVRFMEHVILRYMPKSSENGFLAKFFGKRKNYMDRVQDHF